MNVEYIKKDDFNEEVSNIKRKEQELYKFILQQFLGLEDFKEKFLIKYQIILIKNAILIL